MVAVTDARSEKSDQAFRTIGEVSELLDIPQHVLRFWETKFSHVKPLKRGGGRRYYRPDDVALLRRIRDLLYSEGYTIRGVQKLIKERGVKVLVAEAAKALETDGVTDAPGTEPEHDEPRALEESKPAETTAASGALGQRQREDLTRLRDDLKRLRDRV